MNECFYGKWDAGYHQYHFVGTGGYILVHPALHVRELSLQFVLGSSSHTYFIGYKDEGCVLCREAVEFRLGSGKCPVGIRLEVEEEIGTPQGDAVYQDDPPSSRWRLSSFSSSMFVHSGPRRS